MNATSLEGRVFLLTGAAGGIGEGIARAILEAGGMPALVDVDLEGARAMALRVGMTGPSIAAFRADVSDAGEVERAVEGTVEHFGRIDGAVNNAGVVTLDEAWEATGPDWNHQLEVNVTGSFLVAQAVGKRLKASGGGSIVNVASNCGKVGYRNMAAYNASKSAVLGLTRSLSMEWAEHGINVNAVCPGGRHPHAGRSGRVALAPARHPGRRAPGIDGPGAVGQAHQTDGGRPGDRLPAVGRGAHNPGTGHQRGRRRYLVLNPD